RLDLKFCFDVGHAHMEDGVAISFEAMQDLVVEAHVHDNHGEKDEHLIPYNGKIDWDAALGILAAAPSPLPMVLELREQSASAPSLADATAAFEKLEQGLAAKRAAAHKG
ncbi:MAG: TIM barrel protein, partial [Candidatus Acidiferrales bacterium]